MFFSINSASTTTPSSI